MRILMLNYEFPPLGGGAANANRYLLEEFTDLENLSVDLVTASPEGYREESFGDNIRIYRLDVAKNAIHHWTQMEIARYSWKAYIKSRELMDKSEYDLIHAWFGVPSGVIARALGIPYIIALRGSDVPGYNDRFELQYRLLGPIIKHVWMEAEAVIANSHGLRALALETSQMEIDVIPNGVDVTEFEPVYHDRERHQVLCVSRLIERKGVQFLIEAIAQLDLELTIVGEGEQEDWLRGLANRLGIKDRVTFEGHVPHQEIHAFYENADIFALPSFNEGMSNAVLEAMAAGLPVIVTNTGGTEELIEANGYVVSAGDAESIVDALSVYTSNRDKVRKHGMESRMEAEKRSWAHVAHQYQETYARV